MGYVCFGVPTINFQVQTVSFREANIPDTHIVTITSSQPLGCIPHQGFPPRLLAAGTRPRQVQRLQGWMSGSLSRPWIPGIDLGWENPSVFVGAMFFIWRMDGCPSLKKEVCMLLKVIGMQHDHPPQNLFRSYHGLAVNLSLAHASNSIIS